MQKILIVGAGIGGLAAAACMRKRGLAPLVYEQAPALAEVGAAIAVWPNASRVLRHLGLLDTLLGRAQVAARGVLRDACGRTIQEMSGGSDAPSVFAHRADLHAVLLEAIPRETLQLGKRAVAIEKDDRQVRVAFADGTHSPWADALIGSDGIRSVIRGLTLADGPPAYRGYIAWRGVAEASVTEAGGETWGDRGRRFGLIPLGGGRLGWWGTANVRDPAGTLQAGAAAWKGEVLRLFAGWHSPIEAVLWATPAEAMLCNSIDDRDPVDIWGAGPITLLGDAAHPTTPNLGQGACMAIEDAAVLAHAMEAVPKIETALRVYEASRRRRTAAIVNESRKIGRIGQWESPWACRLRNGVTRRLSGERVRRRFEELWAYDAWNAPLVMPG